MSTCGPRGAGLPSRRLGRWAGFSTTLEAPALCKLSPAPPPDPRLWELSCDRKDLG